jgi:hypothetical protein
MTTRPCPPTCRATSRVLARAGLLLALLGLGAGCHSLKLGSLATDKPDKPEKEQAAVPGMRSFRVSQYVFFADFEVKRDQPIFRELAGLREQVYKELQLPSANTVVQVYLFEDKERYERFMRAKYPDLPARRAFFVAQPHSVGGQEDLLVYTYWGDRVHQDLRHELTHALLHSVLKDVPLWLDEGLAEFFEVPPEWKGVNFEHLGHLRREPFEPDLARLERLGQVKEMKPAEYREAWAWVHLLLRGKPEAKKVLLAYLQQLRAVPNPGPLEARLAAVYPSLNDALDKHLALLDTGPRVTPAASRMP